MIVWQICRNEHPILPRREHTGFLALPGVRVRSLDEPEGVASLHGVQDNGAGCLQGGRLGCRATALEPGHEPGHQQPQNELQPAMAPHHVSSCIPVYAGAGKRWSNASARSNMALLDGQHCAEECAKS